MALITCSKCSEPKPESEYYHRSGRPYKPCKACKRAEAKARADKLREEDPEAYRAFCNSGTREQNNAAKAAWKKRHKSKTKAHRQVRAALATGELEMPPQCAGCGQQAKLYGHHGDYRLPLQVTWLCDHCHKAIHRSVNERGLSIPTPEGATC